MVQWVVLCQVVDELGLQMLVGVSIVIVSGGFDLCSDYVVIDNGIVLLFGMGVFSSLFYNVLVVVVVGGVWLVIGGEVVYVGFWKCVVVYMIDYFVLVVLGGIIGVIIGVVFGVSMGVVGSGEIFIEIVVQLVSVLINMVIGVVYYIWFYFLQGGVMLGKMVVGIKVVCSNGDCLICGCVFGCYWVMLLSSFILGIGFLMVVFIECKQGLYDMICDILVVDCWVYIDQLQFQCYELGMVIIVILVLIGLLVVVGLVLLVVVVGFIVKMVL